jgi:3-oxoacyl-[acyl-carrier protein] reductase
VSRASNKNQSKVGNTLLAQHGVTVNAVAPTLIEDTGVLPGSPDELRRLVPAGRLGKPSEVAGLVLEMVTNGYSAIGVISLQGGMHPR